MFEIIEKLPLNPTVVKMTVNAPLIARKAEPGQFVILRARSGQRAYPADYRGF